MFTMEIVSSTAGEFSSSATPRRQVFHHSCRAMGTRFSMVLPGIDSVQGEALAEFADSFLRSQERLMSRFDAQSPVSELNFRAVEEEPIAVPPALWKILALCRHHWERTRGAFDITQWPLNKLWRAHLEQGQEPSLEAINETRARTGMDRVRFDESARAIKFETPGMGIDLGGMGKGYALDRLAGYFREQGVERAFFSFGESSVTVIGSHPHGPAWPVGVANMFRPEVAAHTFSLRDASLSTSGTAPFNQAVGPQIFGHIINPRDGRPIAGYRTISVMSPSATDAEILSTALLVTPEAERAGILSSYPDVSAIEIIYEPGDNSAPRIQWKYEV
jgi:thiamine biosynthesis lipoprotein